MSTFKDLELTKDGDEKAYKSWKQEMGMRADGQKWDYSIFAGDEVHHSKLRENGSFRYAAKLVYDMKHGEGAWDKEVKENGWSDKVAAMKLGDEGVDMIRWFNNNIVSMGKISKDMLSDSTSQEQKTAFLYLMDSYDHSKTSWDGFFAGVGHTLADPTTYAGIASGGTAIAGSIALRAGIRQSLKFGAKQGFKHGVKTFGKVGVHQFLNKGVRKSYQYGLKKGARRAFTKGLSREAVKTSAVRAGRRNAAAYLAATGGIAATEGYFYGRYTEKTRQEIEIGHGRRETKDWDKIDSAAWTGFKFGGALGVGLPISGTAFRSFRKDTKLGQKISGSWKKLWNRSATGTPPPPGGAGTGTPPPGAGTGTPPPGGAGAGTPPPGGGARVGRTYAPPPGGAGAGTPPPGAGAGTAGGTPVVGRTLLDPKQTWLHKIYGGTIWKSKSIGEITNWQPTNKIGKWFAKKRLKVANPFYTIPARNYPLIGALMGNPSQFLPNEMAMGKYIRAAITQFDDKVASSGLIRDHGRYVNGRWQPGNNRATGPIADLAENIKNITISPTTGGRNGAKTQAINFIDNFASNNAQEIQNLQNNLQPLLKEVEVEKLIGDIVVDLRDKATFKAKSTVPDTALPSDVFKDIPVDKMNNDAKKLILDKIIANGMDPNDWVKRVTAAAAEDRGVLSLGPNESKAMLRWLTKMNDTLTELQDIDTNGRSLYGKNYETFLDRVNADTTKSDDFYQRQVLSGIRHINEIGVDSFKRLQDRHADKLATDFSFGKLFNGQHWKKRQNPLVDTRRLEREISGGDYNPEIRTSEIIPITNKDNGENFGIRIETVDLDASNPKNAQLVSDMMLRAYKNGREEEAYYAAKYLKYKAGASSNDSVLGQAVNSLKKNIPEDLVQPAGNTSDLHWRHFVNKLENINAETFHSPHPRSQRDVLKTWAETTYWPRMARRFPGQGEISTPFRQEFFHKPLRKMAIGIPGYFLGGRAIGIDQADNVPTKFFLHSDKSLRTFGAAKLPKGVKMPDGVTYTNDNGWWRRALWWEKKGTINFDGKKKDFFARAPLWAKIPVRATLAPLKVSRDIAGISWKVAKNPFVKPLLVTTGSLGVGWHLVTEGREYLFNDGEDYDHNAPWNDAGRKYAISPLVYGLDKGLVAPIRQGLKYTYQWNDWWLDTWGADILPEWETLEDKEGKTIIDKMDLYDTYKYLTSVEVGEETTEIDGKIVEISGYSLLDWPNEEEARKKEEKKNEGLDETTPDETTPDETTPDETTPDETTPDETTPDETTPTDDGTKLDLGGGDPSGGGGDPSGGGGKGPGNVGDWGREQIEKAPQNLANLAHHFGPVGENSTMSNMLSSTRGLAVAAFYNAKDFAKNTWQTATTTAGGRTAIGIGGGLLSAWLGMSMFNKWYDNSFLSKIPVLGSVIKLAITAALFFGGWKLTENILQGKGGHTSKEHAHNPGSDSNGTDNDSDDATNGRKPLEIALETANKRFNTTLENLEKARDDVNNKIIELEAQEKLNEEKIKTLKDVYAVLDTDFKALSAQKGKQHNILDMEAHKKAIDELVKNNGDVDKISELQRSFDFESAQLKKMLDKYDASTKAELLKANLSQDATHTDEGNKDSGGGAKEELKDDKGNITKKKENRLDLNVQVDTSEELEEENENNITGEEVIELAARRQDHGETRVDNVVRLNTQEVVTISNDHDSPQVYAAVQAENGLIPEKFLLEASGNGLNDGSGKFMKHAFAEDKNSLVFKIDEISHDATKTNSRTVAAVDMSQVRELNLGNDYSAPAA